MEFGPVSLLWFAGLVAVAVVIAAALGGLAARLFLEASHDASRDPTEPGEAGTRRP